MPNYILAYHGGKMPKVLRKEKNIWLNGRLGQKVLVIH